MKLPLCSSTEVCAALRRAGAKPRKVKRKKSGTTHQVFVRKVDDRTYVVPDVLGKKEIPRGTLTSIIELAGLTEAEFLSALKP